jgi:hypothetical protein
MWQTVLRRLGLPVAGVLLLLAGLTAATVPPASAASTAGMSSITTGNAYVAIG